MFALLGTFLLVIHSGYCQKQDNGQDRYMVKICISFVLLLTKYSWWILPSWLFCGKFGVAESFGRCS